MNKYGIFFFAFLFSCLNYPSQVANHIEKNNSSDHNEEVNSQEAVPLLYKEDRINIEAEEEPTIEVIPEIDLVDFEPEPPLEIEVVLPSSSAQFVGGDSTFREYLTSSIKYPQLALEMHIEGTVYVGFNITKQGKVNMIKIIKGVHKTIDREAMRVIKRMPPWVPAFDRGKKIESEMILPIRFQIN